MLWASLLFVALIAPEITRMIDFHSHVIPESIIAAMRRDPERYATRIEDEGGKRYLVRGKLRLELLAEFSVAEAKLEAMDRKGIELSVS